MSAFSVLGGLYNAYWGLLFAPLLPFGVARAPACLRDLWSAGFGPGEARTPPRPARSNRPGDRTTTAASCSRIPQG